MTNILLKEHKITSFESAELVILNSCAVKLTTENKILYRITKIIETNKKLIVAGCMANTEKDKILRIDKNISLISPQAIHRIAELVAIVKKGERAEFLEDTKEDKLKYHKSRKQLIEIIPIAEGCLNACSFCLTKLARKDLFSYPKEEILKIIKKAVSIGVKEFWLCGEDTGCYGFDRGYTLADLLYQISEIDGKFKVRIGMMNPSNALKILDELVDSFESDKIYKFIHIPVQSGSDKVLKDMLRQNTVKDFLTVVHAFRRKYPRISIATDIIAAFPTETQKDFQKTKKLLKKVKPDITNLSRYSPRPNTLAKKLYSEINSKIVKARTRELTKLINTISFKQNKKWIGWTGEVLISERGRKGFLQGRNYAYKPIIVKQAMLGNTVIVKIKAAYRSHLLANM